MIRNVLIAGAAIVVSTAGALAADVIEPAAYDWTGPYIGLQGGYGWGSSDVSPEDRLSPTSPEARGSPVELFPHADGSIDAEGFIGGLHAGYNWQMDSLLLGVEADGEFADLSGETDVDLISCCSNWGELKKDIDWLASLRLRAGYAADRALFYVTGGLAAGGVDMRHRNVEESGTYSESETAWGWTLGGGLEYALTDDVSARIEYRYTDLANTELDARVRDFRFENDFHAVRAGLSWHF